MEVRWRNVIALALALIAIVVIVKAPGEIGAFLASMRDVGPDHTPQEQTMGLLAYGLVLLAIVAVVKIVTQNNGSDKGEKP